MVPFAGYEMPVQYPAGILTEHNHTRAKASIFDVSHMGQVSLHGDNPAAALETLVPGDIAGLAAGRMRYTMFTNETGGILDDLMVTNVGDYLLSGGQCRLQGCRYRPSMRRFTRWEFGWAFRRNRGRGSRRPLAYCITGAGGVSGAGTPCTGGGHYAVHERAAI